MDAESFVHPREVGEQPWHGRRFTLGIELKERKGHHLALEAWIRVAREQEDLHHFIVGNRAGDPYEEQPLAMASDAGLADRVHLVGNVSEDQKIDLLQRAEVFLHTPVTAADGGFEGFGIVYLEAAAAGTVAIGTLDSGAEDAIVDRESGRSWPRTRTPWSPPCGRSSECGPAGAACRRGAGPRCGLLPGRERPTGPRDL